MRLIWGKFVERNDGATAIEYAFIAGLIAVFIVGALSNVAGALNGVFGNVTTPL